MQRFRCCTNSLLSTSYEIIPSQYPRGIFREKRKLRRRRFFFTWDQLSMEDLSVGGFPWKGRHISRRNLKNDEKLNKKKQVSQLKVKSNNKA
jgi:hypothetical protein